MFWNYRAILRDVDYHVLSWMSSEMYFFNTVSLCLHAFFPPKRFSSIFSYYLEIFIFQGKLVLNIFWFPFDFRSYSSYWARNWYVMLILMCRDGVVSSFKKRKQLENGRHRVEKITAVVANGRYFSTSFLSAFQGYFIT